jgi:class 3 adenylate cyclase
LPGAPGQRAIVASRCPQPDYTRGVLVWKLFTRRVVAKVFLAIGVGVGIALLVQARADSLAEASRLKDETRKWADNIVQLFIGAVEHSMLRGDGIEVKASLDELEARVPTVDVRLYDQRGIEVFGAKPPPPSLSALPAGVAAIVTRAAGPGEQVEAGDRVFRPIPNEERCHSCHFAAGSLRGVIALDIDRQRYARARMDVLARILTAGFTHIMTARSSELLDEYFAELLREVPGINGVAVFDAGAELSYGKDIDGLDSGLIEQLLRPGATTRFEARAEGTLALVPLPMQERCVHCHDEPIGQHRGVLAVSMRSAAEASATGELESIIDHSLRFIMLSKLGRRIADFLDAVAETEAARELELYDELGRLYWTTTHPRPPPPVAEVLATGQTVHLLEGTGMGERLVAIAPLRNKAGCMQCHGSDSPLRGAVSVSVSTAIAAEASDKSMRRRTFFTGVNLLGILFMLGGLLQYFVARPVKRIGDVAEEVGKGNLGVSVERADPEGDEIARLGLRINEMVRGLRTKMHLEKFVSRGAAEAAAGAGLRAISRTGERRAATVLFSDIRGFTSYSENVAPEVVVEMLNRLLRAQAEVVAACGGDIDKYVGDELMAVFTSADAARRAVLCAVQMIDAVRAARKQGETLAVGIGISSGDVIHGAIGHEERMDFTVIGDVVNTGARLCSVAARDEILISAAVRESAGDIEGIAMQPVQPLALKGKREPLQVFRVERT